MRLDRLEISGFMRFRQPAVLDLRDLPAGVIAILGANGEGKTRLLDGALAGLYGPGAPNGAFPSRDGTLATYATARDAFIDTLWDVEGVGTYHARVNVDSQYRESEAVLEQVLADGRRRPLNENGLVKTFREEVAKVFPSRRQVLASAFAAQNRTGGFAALDQRGKLELFAEMLDLRHLEEMSGTARRCAQVCETAHAALDVACGTLAAETADEKLAAVYHRSLEVRADLQAAQARRPETDARIATARADRDRRAQEAERHAVATAEAQAVQRNADGQRQVLAQLEEASAQAVREANHDKAQADKRLANTLASVDRRRTAERESLEALRKDRDDRIRGNLQLVSNAAQIRAAAAALAADSEAIAAATAQERALLDEQDAQRKLLDAAREALRESTDARREVAAAQEQAAVIETVPFGIRCAEAQCQFLAIATSARDRIPTLQAAAAADEQRLAQTTELDSAVRALASRIGEARKARAALQAAVAANTLAKYEPELKHAEERIVQYKRDLEEARQAADQRAGDMDAEAALARVAHLHAIRDATDRLQERMHRHTADAAAAQVQLAAFEAALAAVQETLARTASARQALDKADLELQAAQDAAAAQAADVARLQATYDGARQQEEALQEMRQRLEGLQGRRRQAADEWLTWRLLAQALGRDGLPKLEIDAAGPGVSQLVGQLLAVGYGARFTVDLTTQVERADRKGLKEEFGIRIFDNTHGGERDLNDLSGGERVVVEEALRAGILLFNNARQRRPIRTCWRDETTGALDPENRPRYVAMLRRMHALGGFQHTLFVTHNEELAELADAVIRVVDGVPHLERVA